MAALSSQRRRVHLVTSSLPPGIKIISVIGRPRRDRYNGRGHFSGARRASHRLVQRERGVMTSSAEDCWRLSEDCSRWAVESRDSTARSAFRQMATAWAQLASSQEFISTVADEHTNQIPGPLPAEKAASSQAVAPSRLPLGGALHPRKSVARRCEVSPLCKPSHFGHFSANRV